MTRLPVVPHLTPEEIDRRYRTCPDPAEKTRWHVLWLVTRPGAPPSATAAARLVGFTPAWGRAILKRYNAGGPAALADGRRGNGADPKLSPERQAELLAALQADPPDGGLWSGPKVAVFVRDRWGVEIVPQTGWQWLRDLGSGWWSRAPGTPRSPPPSGRRSGFDRLRARLADLRRQHPGRAVELWCEDEARLGLKPVARRVWARRGTRPTSNGRHRFGAVYVYGFAHPATGRSRFLILPKADTGHMGRALADFASWADPGGRKVLVVLVDNAGWHVARQLAVPPNVVLHHLPSCTPELHPRVATGQTPVAAGPGGAGEQSVRRPAGVERHPHGPVPVAVRPPGCSRRGGRVPLDDCCLRVTDQDDLELGGGGFGY